MAVTAQVTQKLDNNNVRVEVSGKKIPTRYFKVPENKADSFCRNFEKNDRNTGYITGGIIIGAVLGVCTAANILLQKTTPIVRRSVGLAAGVATTIGAMYATAPLTVKREDNLLKEFNASEMNFEKKKFPI